MRKIFTQDTLKHSIKPIIIILLVCTLVWYWGRYHTVTVDLTMHTDIHSTDSISKLDITIIDKDDEPVATLSQVTSSPIVDHRFDLHPGEYLIRGIVTTTTGSTHIVTQTIIVPEDSASIEIYLRE